MPSYVRGSDNFDSLIHQGLGVNQTWQDLTASRVLGATYTNTDVKPRLISCTAKGTTVGYPVSLIVDAVTVSRFTIATTGNYYYTVSAVVPSGSTYTIPVVTGLSVVSWVELS